MQNKKSNIPYFSMFDFVGFVHTMTQLAMALVWVSIIWKVLQGGEKCVRERMQMDEEIVQEGTYLTHSGEKMVATKNIK